MKSVLPAAALSAAACFSSAQAGTQGFNVWIGTKPPSGNTPLMVVLNWPQAEGFTRYNLYRKIDPNAPFPQFPLNPQPLQKAATCAAVQALVPLNSAEWKLIRDALTLENEPPYNPCDIVNLTQGSLKYQRLQQLARTHWKIARLLGQAYRDASAVNGQTYYYELRGLDQNSQETILDSDTTVKAGMPPPIPPPAPVMTIAGDSKVLIHWDDVAAAAGFNVYRSDSLAGWYQLINEHSLASQVLQDFDGNPIEPNDPTKSVRGFVDYQRWTPSGNPTLHSVDGEAVFGPENETTYYFRVRSVDLLGSVGPESATATAKPEDETPPAAPSGVVVVPDDAASRIEVKWEKVSRDVLGHKEIPQVKGYRVFRRGVQDGPDATPVLISGLIPQPGAGKTTVQFFDADPNLRPPYGEKEFWYEVECEDQKGNVGARSSAISGHLKDITPPQPPVGVMADGFDDHITVSWTPNTEPDLDGYFIYRSLCHEGFWLCAHPQSDQFFKAECREAEETIVPLGYVSKAEAQANGTQFADFSIPKGSPLCYAYLVKAQDQAQNQSGTMPPDPAKEQIVCQRLRDKTPPEPAIIAGLTARDDTIRVEWIGAPVQDIKAYHVYRGIAKAGPYQWVGGMTVEKPPNPPLPLAQPYQAPATTGCQTIPLTTHEGMSAGFLNDVSAAPKQIYWYKVVGIDQNGNEASLEKAVPVSTFTYSTAAPATPVITSVTQGAAPCALDVSWTPGFDPSKHIGFALFRSDGGPLYLQIGSLITGGSAYSDRAVVKGKTYTYKVVQVNLDGTMSALSAGKSGTPN